MLEQRHKAISSFKNRLIFDLTFVLNANRRLNDRNLHLINLPIFMATCNNNLHKNFEYVFGRSLNE